MRPTSTHLILAIAVSSAVLYGQAASTDQRKVTQEINERLSSARSNAKSEEQLLQKEAAVRAASNLPQLAAQALVNRDSKEQRDEDERLKKANSQLDASLKNVSPEGRILLAQAKTSATPDTPPEIIPPGAAKPVPLQPTPLEEPEKKGPKQAIINAETNYFDPSNSISIFENNVTAKHPDFDITCERLEIHMKKTEKKAGPKPAAPDSAQVTTDPKATPPPAPEPEAAAVPQGQSGIEKAIATGPLVVVTQHAPDGTDKIGKGRHVTYDGKTGDITLRGMPQIQDGFNMIIATSAETWLVITAAGQIKTFGPHQTKLVQDDGGSSKPKNKSAASGGTAQPRPTPTPAPSTPTVAPTRTVIQPPTKKGR